MAGVPGFGTELDAVPKLPQSHGSVTSWCHNKSNRIPLKGNLPSLLLWLSVDGWWNNVIADGSLGGWRDNSDFTPRGGWGKLAVLGLFFIFYFERQFLVLGLETSPLLVIIFPLLNDLVLPAAQIQLGWAAISWKSLDISDTSCVTHLKWFCKEC